MPKTNPQSKELFHHDFIGNWCLNRRIREKLSTKAIFLNGSAHLTHSSTLLPNSNFLKYDRDKYIFSENGMLDYYGTKLNSSNSFVWIKSKNEWLVSLKNGTHFFSISLSERNQKVYYTCGEDKYDGHIKLISGCKFVITWKVHGPRKCYLIKTIYKKILNNRTIKN